VKCALGAGLLLAGCGAGAGGAPAENVVVTSPVAPRPIEVTPGTEVAQGARTRFDMTLGTDGVCMRIESNVKCARPLEEVTHEAPKVADALGIAAGRDFACAVVTDGNVMCWGDNEKGQLGAGLTLQRADVPRLVKGVTHATRVIAGHSHACAIVDDGKVLCWGDNASGQTGSSIHYTEAVNDLVEATPVPNLTGVSFAAASAQTTCVLFRDRGTPFCWGVDALLRDGAYGERQSEVPRKIPALTGYDDLATNYSAFCGVKDGVASCWGESYSLVPGFRGNADHPVAATIPGRVRKVRVGDLHACALTDDGRVYCWGSNTAGSLGRTTGGEAHETPGPGLVDDLPRAVDLWVGGTTSCALTDARELRCWGRWWANDHEFRTEQRPVTIAVE
jgi:alpha-tubulin suppressor-like RCC1 family protein